MLNECIQILKTNSITLKFRVYSIGLVTLALINQLRRTFIGADIVYLEASLLIRSTNPS
jgi:hypothetical protein